MRGNHRKQTRRQTAQRTDGGKHDGPEKRPRPDPERKTGVQERDSGQLRGTRPSQRNRGSSAGREETAQDSEESAYGALNKGAYGACQRTAYGGLGTEDRDAHGSRGEQTADLRQTDFRRSDEPGVT